MIVFGDNPSPQPLASSGGKKPTLGSSGISPVAGSIVVKIQEAMPVRSSIVAVTSTT